VNPTPGIDTPRLHLRPWTFDDLEAFHGIWGDPQVIFWAKRWDRDESRAVLEKVFARCAGRPFPMAWLGAFSRATGVAVGNFMLQPAPWDASEIEVGWHLRRDSWGQGYATEGAAALLRAGFDLLRPARIVCSILPANTRSQQLASRLGFTRYAENVLRADLPHDLLELRAPPAAP